MVLAAELLAKLFSLLMRTVLMNTVLAVPQASEAAIAYHVHVEELKGCTQVRLLDQLNNLGNLSPTDERGDIAKHPDGSRGYFHEVVHTSPPPPTSNLPALTVALLDAGQGMGADVSRKNELMQAAQGVSVSSGQNVQAVASVVRETLNLVHSISQRQQCGCGGIAFGVGSYMLTAGEQDRSYGIAEGEDVRREWSRLENFLVLLAEVWTSLYATSPDCQLSVVNSLQGGLPPKVTVKRVFEDLTGLAILAVNAATSSAAGYSEDVAGQQPDGATNPAVQARWSAVVLNEMSSATPRNSEYPPWLPALQLMLWGAISAVGAESTLLSFFQESATAQSTHTADMEKVARERSRDALCVVITGVVKGYHSWATQQDMSRVPVANLLDYAADSLAKLPLRPTICRHYHPMNLSRVVARLAVV